MNTNSFVTFLKRIFNWKLFKEAYQEWNNDNASRLASSLAYYTATALAPLIIGVLALIGFVYSREQAQLQIVDQVRRYVGPQGAEIVETILANADQPDLARLAGLLSLVILLWSASNIFAQLQDSLDTVWGVQLRKDLPLMRKIQHRLIPLLTVLGIGLLLLVVLVATTALTAIGEYVSGLLPGGTLLWQIVNFLVGIVVITLLFGIIFKVLPDVQIAWSDVWPGAVITAILFTIGQYILSWYLGRQSGASLYGAAGSLIILLLWLYYTAQIFLFGTEITQVYATRYGKGVRPNEDAVARDQAAPTKVAAQQANANAKQEDPDQDRVETAGAILTRPLSSTAIDGLSLGGLVTALLDDARQLFHQEIALAKAEIREAFARMARGLAFVAGGSLLLFGALLFVLIAVSVLLWALTTIPLWLAVLLVGLLTAAEGWILTIWARKRLAQVEMPKQTLQAVRKDVDVVKEHLAT